MAQTRTDCRIAQTARKPDGDGKANAKYIQPNLGPPNVVGLTISPNVGRPKRSLQSVAKSVEVKSKPIVWRNFVVQGLDQQSPKSTKSTRPWRRRKTNIIHHMKMICIQWSSPPLGGEQLGELYIRRELLRPMGRLINLGDKGHPPVSVQKSPIILPYNVYNNLISFQELKREVCDCIQTKMRPIGRIIIAVPRRPRT